MIPNAIFMSWGELGAFALTYGLVITIISVVVLLIDNKAFTD